MNKMRAQSPPFRAGVKRAVRPTSADPLAKAIPMENPPSSVQHAANLRVSSLSDEEAGSGVRPRALVLSQALQRHAMAEATSLQGRQPHIVHTPIPLCADHGVCCRIIGWRRLDCHRSRQDQKRKPAVLASGRDYQHRPSIDRLAAPKSWGSYFRQQPFPEPEAHEAMLGMEGNEQRSGRISSSRHTSSARQAATGGDCGGLPEAHANSEAAWAKIPKPRGDSCPRSVQNSIAGAHARRSLHVRRSWCYGGPCGAPWNDAGLLRLRCRRAQDAAGAGASLRLRSCSGPGPQRSAEHSPAGAAPAGGACWTHTPVVATGSDGAFVEGA